MKKKAMKSKILFNSIKTLLLLLNKISRLSIAPSATMTITRLNLDMIFNSLIGSMSQIINHILFLNNSLSRMQQEQSAMMSESEASSNNPYFNNAFKKQIPVGPNYISLKRSNEVVKQFHSLANTLMILVTSFSKANMGAFDLSQLIDNLVLVLDKLVADDFNYFPSIINSIQSCLLHLFVLNMDSEAVDAFLNGANERAHLKKLVGTLCKIFAKSCVNLEAQWTNESSSSVEFEENSNVKFKFSIL